MIDNIEDFYVNNNACQTMLGIYPNMKTLNLNEKL